ncbi:MAG: TetR/AcrR family transcriptional regulator, partial [Treponema sp.]|nr:TetR/AcrR family transcriptional regulator [Treponema sp.]
HQLFMTESMRIINFARQGIGQSAVPQEQLYLGIFSIAEYLRSKPDILVALDWIRNRKLNFPPADKKMHAPAIESLRLFDEIDIGYLQNDGSPFRLSSNISPWILFLIVNTLMREDSKKTLGKVPVGDIRLLYRFLMLGIGGF